MQKTEKIVISFFLSGIFLGLCGCSTQKNTAKSRWWQAFNARYNTYYNGTLAYIDGSLEKENGNKDNFTELIPLYTVGNKNSKELGKANFEKAIEKCEKAIHLHSIRNRPDWNKNRRKTPKDLEWLNRKEYNPFLWKCWMLMGRSQFHKGAFEDAASTFSYMSRLYATQPAIYGKARAWLAKCYIEQGWRYDAEDVIRNMERDSIDWRAKKEWDYTYADYYIHTGEYEKAVPWLRKVIKHEMRRKQKAREWFLMGQLETAVGHRDLAYESFRHVLRENPPYELAFNARIAMTEVLAGGQQKKMITRLRRMAQSDNNKDYLDQIYYAIGNIYLSQKDTAQAIAAYEQGNRKATRSGIEKGVLLQRLGDLYWTKGKFSDARRCYGEAIGLLDKDRKDYIQLSQRSKVLDELVPYTDAIHLQDSLQTLAKMDEKDRNAAIDRVIAALKKKEKEEREAQADKESANRQGQNPGYGKTNSNPNGSNTSSSGLWYFYNPMTVTQGKETFQKQWGKRENVDNWQRINKTVVAGMSDAEETDSAQIDSIDSISSVGDSLKNKTDSAKNDPHKRDYYLAQIPFTEAQILASNKIIEDGLYHSGVIFKDQLDLLPLSEKALRRLADHYPDYEHRDDLYYHLFLLYSRMGQSQKAEDNVRLLQREYPNSQWTTLLTDPHFVENAKFGVQIEDSLYAATYDAFKADRYQEVNGNVQISAKRFPTGANRDKFLFIGGLSKLNSGNTEGCMADMNEVVKDYPNSRISEMAGMIVNGVKAGRKLHSTRFDLSNVWARRSEILNDSDSIKARNFSPDRSTNFIFMIAFKPDSLNENQLLYELARFNFTTYLVRNFDMTIDQQDDLHRMLVKGFRNYDEALEYAHSVFRQEGITRLLHRQTRTLIISEPNLELLGTRYSYDDYDKFYALHFAPLKVSTNRLLTEPVEIETRKELENPVSKEQASPSEDGIYIDNSLESPKSEDQQGITVTPEQEKPSQRETHTQDLYVIPEDHPTPASDGTGNNSLTIPVPPPSEKKDTLQKTTVPPVRKQQVTPPAETKVPVPKKEDTGIYFDDGFGQEEKKATGTKAQKDDKNKKEKKSNDFDLEDEYYDLGGF